MAGVFTPAPADHAEAVASLYADYPEFHRLKAFPRDYTAEALRADYDLAQAQALLYSATRVTVEAGRDFKHVLRYARLAQLLYQVERIRARTRRRRPPRRSPPQPGRAAPTPAGAGRVAWASPEADGADSDSLTGGDGYRFVLDGPNSVLRRTRAYGVDFARFLAALVRLGDWRLQAEIELRKGWRPLLFTLASQDGLGAGLGAPPEFDSSLEEAIARKFGRERAGWRLVAGRRGARGRREPPRPGLRLPPRGRHRGRAGDRRLLDPGVPGRQAGQARGRARVNLIVAGARHLAVRAGALPATVLPFKRRLLLRDLLPRLEAFRGAVTTGRLAKDSAAPIDSHVRQAP